MDSREQAKQKLTLYGNTAKLRTAPQLPFLVFLPKFTALYNTLNREHAGGNNKPQQAKGGEQGCFH